MKFGIREFLLGAAVLCLSGAAVSSKAQNVLSAEEVVQRTLERARHSEARGDTPDFNYTRLTLTEQLDSAGRVKERQERRYEVQFRDGVTRVLLLSINGHPPTDDERQQQADNEKNLRKLLGPSRSSSGNASDDLLTPDVAARFQFTLVGVSELNGRRTCQIAFEPKNPPPPERRLADRLLNRISGTVWIDAEDFEIARAEVFLRSEVNLFGGVVASLKRLAYTIERTRVADGVWFSTFSTGDFQGRKLLEPAHIRTRSQSVNFRQPRTS